MRIRIGSTVSNRSGFTGGFFAGALLGGVVGGVLGAVLANRQTQDATVEDETRSLPAEGGRQLARANDMESARRNLEDKIAQLNDTIDDVREQLHVVNGSSLPRNDNDLTVDEN